VNRTNQIHFRDRFKESFIYSPPRPYFNLIYIFSISDIRIEYFKQLNAIIIKPMNLMQTVTDRRDDLL